jgi:flagellar biosynthesis protein FlhA
VTSKLTTGFAVAVLGVVAILIVPLPPPVLGALIPAFGQFVVRGNVVVGLIVFAILITIQFVVLANGAQRGQLLA